MSLLSATTPHQPSTWSIMNSGTQVARFCVNSSSEEYESVLSKVDLKLVHGKGFPWLVRIQNPYLWGCYLLKKAECLKRDDSVTEKVLYHVTAQSNVNSIAENNFDWRRSVRTRFGRGVSFSPSAAYADKYCNRDIGSDRALFVARVLVGRDHYGDYSTELPQPGYDTTVGNGEKVYVKYYDN
jgi:hypothetical protein